MKKVIITFFFIFFLASGYCCGNAFSLQEQAAIDLCVFTEVNEGIIDLLWLKADALWHKGKYGEIFPVLRLITLISPAQIQAWSLGGWFLINGIAPQLSEEQAGKIKEYAVDFLKEGVKKNPEDYKLYWELAWIYYNDENFSESLKYLDQAGKYSHPFHVENLKAHIYMKTGQKEKAVSAWEEVKKRYPEREGIAEKFLKRLKNGS
jgi:tetratricopeptide (TPR) repeat protein